jgi:hypothetical protein
MFNGEFPKDKLINNIFQNIPSPAWVVHKKFTFLGCCRAALCKFERVFLQRSNFIGSACANPGSGAINQCNFYNNI